MPFSRVALLFVVMSLCASASLAEHPVRSGTDDEDRLRELVRELRELTSKAERERAADRWLQRDLEKLVRRYSPRRLKELLHDNFRDGDYTRNPAWEVLEGEFRVYREHGLVSSATRNRDRRESPGREDRRSQEERMQELIVGALLGQGRRDEPEPESASGDNIIQLRADVPNVFAVELAFRLAPDRGNRFDLLLLQERDGRFGYRLSMHNGRRDVARLYRVSRGREMLLQEAELPAELNDGRRHDLAWRHKRDGRVDVLVNGRAVITLEERSFRDGYPWLRIHHKRGDMAIRSLTVKGFERR